MQMASQRYQFASPQKTTRHGLNRKETYEPLWEELNARVKGHIRGIWIADCSHQGASGVLNENVLGDDRMFSISFYGRCYLIILLNKLVRSFPGSASHGQPFLRIHSSTDHRCRTQLGLCSTVGRRCTRRYSHSLTNRLPVYILARCIRSSSRVLFSWNH